MVLLINKKIVHKISDIFQLFQNPMKLLLFFLLLNATMRTPGTICVWKGCQSIQIDREWLV